MKKALGTAIFLTFALTVWSAQPLVAIMLNALLRPDYVVRDIPTEYLARLLPNRVYWFDYKGYRMDCAGQGKHRVVILHTIEFNETPHDFLARSFPQCSNVQLVKEKLPGMFHGLAVGRI